MGAALIPIALGASVLGAGATVWIQQDRPLPLTIVALMLEVAFEG